MKVSIYATTAMAIAAVLALQIAVVCMAVQHATYCPVPGHGAAGVAVPDANDAYVERVKEATRRRAEMEEEAAIAAEAEARWEAIGAARPAQPARPAPAWRPTVGRWMSLEEYSRRH